MYILLNLFIYVYVLMTSFCFIIFEEMEGETKWSVENEEMLIDMWQESPCLYEITSKDYANKVERKKAIDNMAMKLSISSKFFLQTHQGRVMQSMEFQFSFLLK
jgi:Alcohol dehydrogenase transcription factor Myb/SANT-like